MNQFRVSFRRFFRAPYQTMIVSARDASHAMEKIGSAYSVRSISIQCEGTTAAGTACQQWTGDGHCRAHAPKTNDTHSDVGA